MLVSASLFLSRDFLGERPLGKQAMNFCGKLSDLCLVPHFNCAVEGGGKN